ncbi:MAG: RCC1 domain-containing protein [Pseudobacter sp.]|uniref:RCC1 domain-containing protein n=1 Tax=Pseudobacter sp. TaxID=2045420 RepID=UPI003F821AAA
MKRLLIVTIISIRGLCSFAQTLSDNWIASYRSKAGIHHVIALSNGQVMTWQAGGEMQRIEGLENAIQVSGGEEHLLVLDKSGYVYTLGSNDYYQLGDADLVAKKVRESSKPVKVKGLKDVIAISAFSNTNYALRKDGTVWAWGNGNEGLCGDGQKVTSGMYSASASGKKEPVKVMDLDDVVAISGPMALRKDGSVWTWGDGYQGRLGRGDVKSESVPAKVPGIENATAISGSRNGGFVLLKDGTVKAWGTNYKGQLGTGIPSSKIYQGSKAERSLIPVSVIKLNNVKAINASSSILALRKDGTVMGWGWGELSALGPLGGDVTSTPVHVHKLSGVKAVKAGNGAGFALLNDGTLVGWGSQMVATGVYKHSKTVITIKKLGSLAPQ